LLFWFNEGGETLNNGSDLRDTKGESRKCRLVGGFSLGLRGTAATGKPCRSGQVWYEERLTRSFVGFVVKKRKNL